MNLDDKPFDYDELLLEAVKQSTNEQALLHHIMKKTHGLANPKIVKEKIKAYLKRPQD